MGASRIDRSYHWGEVTIVEAGYHSIAFSDHMALIVKITLPGLEQIISQFCPHFKTSPEVVFDKLFKSRMEQEMVGWQHVRQRSLLILPWWEIVVKPGIRRLAINHSKELNNKRGLS